MKPLMRSVLAIVFVLSLLGLHACSINAPELTHPNIPTPTPTPQMGTVVVNDASTGTCPVNVWLDSNGPVTVIPGTIQTFPNVPSGTHTLTFNTTYSVNCSASPTPVFYACKFNYNGISTGAACSFNLNGGQVQTASITDDGCSLMNLHCPY